MELFGRRVELYVDETLLLGEELTIEFDVSFDDDSEANIATAKVYNLSNHTIAKMRANKSRVILNAGYAQDYGAILLGFLKEVKTEWSGVDKVTTLTVVDGNDSWFAMPYKKTFAPGVTGRTILGAMIAETGLSIGAFNLPVNHVYRSGKTIKTTLSAAIKAVAQDCGAKAHVTRGKVFIRPKNQGDNFGFKVDAEHGLIASPTPVEKEVQIKLSKPIEKVETVIGKDGKPELDKRGKQKTKKTTISNRKETRRGFKIVTLLNHRITTDTLIDVTSRTANGVFRVESGKHTNNGTTFYTEMEVYPV